jgi:NAD(P)-dependent dehydrogenase (short-subunit alcohol dehydrogenase family)
MEGFAGKVAVVTGAGSGIGQALAIELARSGARVAISDVNTEGLAATEERLKAIGAQVKADRLDVTEREAFELYADAVKSTSARSTRSTTTRASHSRATSRSARSKTSRR